MIAFDTNVFIYAIGTDHPRERERALDLLRSTPASDVVLPWQVACETGAVVSRLRRKWPVPDEAFKELKALRERYALVMPTPAVLDAALGLHANHQVSYWDSLLLAACFEAGVRRLYSQDVPSAPVIQGVEIVNPFAG